MSVCDFDDIRKVIDDLEREAKSLRNENQKLNVALNQTRRDICCMEELNDKLIEDLDGYDPRLKDLRDNIEHYKRRVEQNEHEVCFLEKLCSKVRTLEDAKRELLKKLDCTQKEICKSKEDVDAMKENIISKAKCLAQLEHGTSLFQKVIDETKRDNDDLSSRSAHLKSELEQCRFRLYSVQQDIGWLDTKQADCECTNGKLREQAEDLIVYLEENCTKIDAEKADGCKLQAQIQTALYEQGKLKAHNSYFREEKKAVCREITLVHQMLKDCDCEYHKSKMEWERQKKCIEQFRNQLVTGVGRRGRDCRKNDAIQLFRSLIVPEVGIKGQDCRTNGATCRSGSTIFEDAIDISQTLVTP